MSCLHCCSSCTAEGEDMSMKVVRQALELCAEHDMTPFIGGGEPTLHPQFEQILLESMAYGNNCTKIGVITNGSVKKRAMIIAKLTKAGIIHGELSQDQYHDPIDPEVVYAFEKLGKPGTFNSGIRDTSRGGSKTCLPHGRGVELLGLLYHEPDCDEEDTRTDMDCPGAGHMVLPNGVIRQCGCEDSPEVGRVNIGIVAPLFHGCCRDSEFAALCIVENRAELVR